MSILVSGRYSAASTRRSSGADTQHAPGEDEWGYEDAGERWLPVHTVESVVSGVRSPLITLSGFGAPLMLSSYLSFPSSRPTSPTSAPQQTSTLRKRSERISHVSWRSWSVGRS